MKRHLAHIVIAGTATAALLLATGAGLGQALAFAILIVMLIVKPTGILGGSGGKNKL